MDSDRTPVLTEPIHRGRTFAVHRGTAGPDGRRVICKIAAEGVPRGEALMRLENEFALTRELGPANLVRAEALVASKSGSMLVFADEGLAALDRRPAGPMAPGDVLRVAHSLAAALDEVHGHGIVHRDVQPSNVVASPNLSTVRLIDFCRAARQAELAGAPRDATEEAAEASWLTPYSAPEQRGLPRAPVDHRADLYALGVTLYELLTGRLPGRAGDGAPHDDGAAADVLTPGELDPSIPDELSAAVMTLIREAPDDRFQTAAEFQAALTSHPGARRRGARRVEFAETLYGRQALVEQLSTQLVANAVGPSRLLRVAGASGVGKTALIEQATRAAAGAGVAVATGRCDAAGRAAPYSVIAQALGRMLRDLMGRPADEIEAVRLRLADAAAIGGSLLAGIVPDLAGVIGAGPPVAELGLAQGRVRAAIALRRLVRALAPAEAPLILVLDDLHWVDPASLELIDLVLGDPEIRNLTILAAYREDEFGHDHAARRLFAAIGSRMDLAPAIQLGPLDELDATLMISDALREPVTKVAGLAKLLQQRAGGNPLALRQALIALDRHGLIRHRGGGWRWDPAEIEAAPGATDVGGILAERIVDLPPETQELLCLAASAGTGAESEILSLAAGLSPVETERRMAPALANELVVSDGPSGGDGRRVDWRFRHDRIGRAVAATLPADRAGALHAKVGAAMLRRIQGVRPDRRLAVAVDQLIAGASDLAPDLRARLRDLALAAARWCLGVNAPAAARVYLGAVAAELGEAGWQTDPARAFEAALAGIAVSFLLGDTEAAKAEAQALLARDLARLDEVRVHMLLVEIEIARQAHRGALRAGRQALELLGVRLPQKPSPLGVRAALAATRLRLRRMTPRRLLGLPRMTDPAKLAAMRLLDLLTRPAAAAERHLLGLIGLRMTALSAEYGVAPQSAVGFAVYGWLHCAVLGAPARGLAYGELARRVAAEHGGPEVESRTAIIFAGLIQPWSRPLHETLPVLRGTWRTALMAGDPESHGLARCCHAGHALLAGQPLGLVAEQLDQHLAAMAESGDERARRLLLMARAGVARMRGREPDQSHGFDEAESVALWTEGRDGAALAWFHLFRMLEAAMAGNHAEVLAQARQVDARRRAVAGTAVLPFCQFHEALACLTLLPTTLSWRRIGLGHRARRIARRFLRWSRHAPQGYLHRALLLAAELDALAGRTSRAMARFERALGAAREAGALNDIALINERIARFYLTEKATSAAGAHLVDAIAAYEAWQAEGWAEALRSRYAPDAGGGRDAEPQAGADPAAGPAGGPRPALLAAIAGVARAGSDGDIAVEAVRAAIALAEADRGAVLLLGDGVLRVAAEARGKVLRQVDRRAAESHPAIPRSVVERVTATGESLVLDGADLAPDFAADIYLRTAAPSSVLCLPLADGDEVLGVLYLEAAKIRWAFTPDRVADVAALCDQAAIALGQARRAETLRATLKRQEGLVAAQARFLPHEFLAALGRSGVDGLRAGDHLRVDGSVLVAKVRGFNESLTRLAPEQAVRRTSELMARVEPAVQAGGGFLVGVLGDSVAAVFRQGSEAGVTAALALARGLDDWRRAQAGLAPIRSGIGIATGALTFCAVSAGSRMRSAVIGESVTLAARVEELTARYGVGVLITQGTYRRLPDAERFLIREVDLVSVIGREAPVRLFEVFDADPAGLREQKLATRPHVSQGLRLYRMGAVDQAAEIFEQCRSMAPDDPLMGFLHERCLRAGERARDAGWDGIERFGHG